MEEPAALPAEAHIFIPYEEYLDLLAHKSKSGEKLQESHNKKEETWHNFPKRVKIDNLNSRNFHQNPPHNEDSNDITAEEMEGSGASNIKKGSSSNLSRQERDVNLQLTTPTSIMQQQQHQASSLKGDASTLSYQDAGVELPADAADLRQVGSSILNEPMGTRPGSFPPGPPQTPVTSRVIPPHEKVVAKTVPFWYIG